MLLLLLGCCCCCPMLLLWAKVEGARESGWGKCPSTMGVRLKVSGTSWAQRGLGDSCFLARLDKSPCLELGSRAMWARDYGKLGSSRWCVKDQPSGFGWVRSGSRVGLSGG